MGYCEEVIVYYNYQFKMKLSKTKQQQKKKIQGMFFLDFYLLLTLMLQGLLKIPFICFNKIMLLINGGIKKLLLLLAAKDAARHIYSFV